VGNFRSIVAGVRKSHGFEDVERGYIVGLSDFPKGLVGDGGTEKAVTSDEKRDPKS
jgi:hypothetical protein